MLSNYYTLRYIASTIDSTIRGWRISEIYSQDKDELAVAFHDDDRHLVISCRSEGATLYLRERMARAKRNTVDLLPGALGRGVRGVRVLDADRVVEIDLDAGVHLTALLYGSKSNVLLLDPPGTVLDAFKSPKKLMGTVVSFEGRGALQEMPLFRAAAASAGTATASSVLRKSLPLLGATLVQEVLSRAGIPPSTAASRLEASSLNALEAALSSVKSDLMQPLARVYMEPEGAPAIFSIIPLQMASAFEERRFDSVHDAVRFFLTRRAAAVVTEEGKGALVSALRQRIEKARRTRQAIDEDARGAERADEYGRYADLLMSNLQAFPKGSRSVVLAGEGEDVTIPLEPSLSPMQNAQRYYEKAKRARATVRETAGRAGEIDGKIARGERLLAAAELCATREEVKTFMTENAEALDEFGIGQKSKEHEEIPFRIFTVEGGFEVWAGKNSANNDLLTLRYAKPDDLWFHARGAGGSHVVLKVGTARGEPGKKAREQAAAIAAYYSKMKNAGMVPVAMTEKRYVRKPKGSKAGTVVIEREKVIFAAPALPSPQKNVSP